VTRLRWNTAGESHGPALLGILEGLPAGLELDWERVQRELTRRQGGYGRGGRMRIEQDQVEVLSGVRAGRTLGSPLALRIANKDATIERLPVPDNPRPGHADLAGCQKYAHQDPRAVLERASARETAMRVAIAACARQVLERFSIEVFGCVRALGGIESSSERFERAFAASRTEREAVRAGNEFYLLDATLEPALRERVDAAKAAGDTLGGIVEVRAFGLPPGLGSYQSAPERLSARLGAALFSIPAIKGVEIGHGFALAGLPGSKAHDPIRAAAGGEEGPGRYRRESNRAGGLEGGMSTGEPLVLRAAMKPIPTLRDGLGSVRFKDLSPVKATYQRSDVTSVPAVSVIAEAMVALELTAAFLESFGGDSLEAVEASYHAHVERLRRV
jgi:chorismate synthase